MSLLSSLVNKVKQEVEKKINELGAEIAHEESTSSAPAAAPASCGNACDYPTEGDTWYDHVPAEENQYNYNGPYLEYFEKIFREDFPEYTFERIETEEFRRYVYALKKDELIAIVVELMTENSSVNRVRKECLKSGTAYVRFYFDHEGWWNTRAYVVDRIKSLMH
jgi:hypothetical protein